MQSIYATCPPFMLPEPPLAPDPTYVPKIIVLDNFKHYELLATEVRFLIWQSAIDNPTYRPLSNRLVKKVDAPNLIPLDSIVDYLNPDRVSPETTECIFRNRILNTLSRYLISPKSEGEGLLTHQADEADPSQPTTSRASASQTSQASTSQGDLGHDPQSPLASGSGNRRKYECKSCHKLFTTPANLKSHEATHRGIKLYKCETCSKKFSYQSSICRHKKIHENRKLKCAYSNNGTPCIKAYTSKDQLNEHINKVHTKANKYKCRAVDCEKVFYRLTTRATHERGVHQMSGKR